MSETVENGSEEKQKDFCNLSRTGAEMVLFARIMAGKKCYIMTGKEWEWVMLLKKFGIYRKASDCVKFRKNRHEKVPQRPDRPLRDVYFDTICDFLRLFLMDKNHPRSLEMNGVRGVLFCLCICSYTMSVVNIKLLDLI